MKKFNKFILPATSAAIALSASSCDKEKQFNDKLVGQWEITEVDGDLEEALENEYDYKINFEFHLEGDAEFCTIYDEDGYNAKMCILGEWEWSNDDHDQIVLKIGDTGEITIDVNSIEDEIITGEMTIENEDGDSYSGDITLEKVYVDKSAMKDVNSENGKPQIRKFKFMK